MWSGEDKVWTRFRPDVTAADRAAASLLISYLRWAADKRIHPRHLEVYDLQRYKVIRRPRKVRAALDRRLHLPFVFVAGKN